MGIKDKEWVAVEDGSGELIICVKRSGTVIGYTTQRHMAVFIVKEHNKHLKKRGKRNAKR